MLPLRFARRWHALSAVLLILVLIATLMPAFWYFSSMREFANWFSGFDKWMHGITFTFLAVWFSGQYASRAYWRIAVGLILFGLLIEACQRLVSYRSAEWFDVAADSAGIVLGLTIAMAGLGGWSLRFERWLVARKAATTLE